MRTRWSLALCASSLGLLALSACGDTDKPGGDSDARDQEEVEFDARTVPAVDAGSGSRFLIRWTLMGGCLSGDEVEAEVGSGSDGRTFVKRFPCNAGSGLTDTLSPGEFDLVLRVFDNDVVVPPDAGPSAGPLVAQSDSSGPHATVENGTATIDVAFPTNTATIATEWTFALGKEAQTCAQAGVVNVDVEYERVGGTIERQLRVACADGGDPSGDLPTGLYRVRATPLDGAGATVFPQLETEVALFVGNVAASTRFAFAPPQI